MSEEDDQRAVARVGSTLNDKWTLERLIGIGGMAAVYAGKHRNGARAAVKVLHPDISKIQEARERFIREGYAANSVEHPGVVKVLDDDKIEGGEDEGSVYLVMELLEGESLEDRIERGPPMSDRELLPIMKGVLEVLAAAHSKGIIHRDLKPENLFLAKQEDGTTRVKVLDFGLARIQDRSIQTIYGLALGTPSYMPPEQAAGKITEIDARSDLFALGASCFRLLTGRTVHPGSNALEIVMKMAKEPPPKIRTVEPKISKTVAAIIDKSLEFKREDRYADAATMLADVDAALASAPEPEPVPTAPPPPIAKIETKAPSVDLSLPHGVPRRSSFWPILIVLGLGGVAAWLTWDTFFKPKEVAVDAGAEPADEGADDVVTDVASADVRDASLPKDSGVAAPVDAASDAPVDAPHDAKTDGGKDAGIKDAGVKDAGKKPKPVPTKPK
jgi:serine/threonine protein kinase